ncbi:MAG TPA: hypothetical protein VEY88_16000, partial [Archangium sp.]|nr:hypothetical protein [Archangium sp.]
ETVSSLGLDVDELVEAYVQAVLAAVAVDRSARRLAMGVGGEGALLRTLNADPAFLAEVWVEEPRERTEPVRRAGGV